MDEAYDSPDSDGHGSLPSVSDSTFDLSRLPPPKIPYSELSALQSDESSDLSSGDDDGGSVIVKANPSNDQYLSSSPPFPPFTRLSPINQNLPAQKKRTVSSQFDSSVGNLKPAVRSLGTVKELGKEIDERISEEDEEGEDEDEDEDADADEDGQSEGASAASMTPPRGAGRMTDISGNQARMRRAGHSPSSTPDPATGLPKRIVVRKNRSSPPKSPPKGTGSPASTAGKRRSRKPLNDRLEYSSSDSDVENQSPRLPARKSKTCKRRARGAQKDVPALSGHLAEDEAAAVELEDSDNSEEVGFMDSDVEVLRGKFHNTSLQDQPVSTTSNKTDVADGSGKIGNTAFVDINVESEEGDGSRESQQTPTPQTATEDHTGQSADQIISMVDDSSSTPSTVVQAPVKSVLIPRETDETFDVSATPSSQQLSNSSAQKSSTASSNYEGDSSGATETPGRLTTVAEHPDENSLNSRDNPVRATVSEVDAAFPDNTTRNITSRGGDISTGDHFNETPLASSTPRNSLGHISVPKLKNSRLARRVSINTPPSQLSHTASMDHASLPSSLSGSEWKFPKTPTRYDEWDPTSVHLEFKPILPIDHQTRDGIEAPPNSTNSTPATQVKRTSWQLSEAGHRRKRAKSDPLDVKGDRGSDSASENGDKMLFTPTRVVEKPPISDVRADEGDENASEELQNAVRSMFSSDSKSDEEAEDEDEEEREEEEDEEEEGAEEEEDEEEEETEEEVGEEDDDEGELKIVDDAERQSHSDSGNRGHLWSGFTEEFRHGPSNANEFNRDKALDEISESKGSEQRSLSLAPDDHVRYETPVSLGGQPTKARTLSDGSVDLPPALERDNAALRLRVAQLERYIRTMESREEETKSEASKWQNQYQQLEGMLDQYRRITVDLKRHVSPSGSKEDEISNASILETPSRQLPTPPPLRTPGPHQLEEKIKLLEHRLSQSYSLHDEKDKEIGRLRSALHQTQPPDSNGLVHELRQRIADMEQKHKADLKTQDEKLKNILRERDAELYHLQMELDELNNLVPVDHGNSSQITGDNSESWYEEKSRELNEYVDQSIGRIITELHGVPDEENEDAAAEEAEAERSLKAIAENAGYHIKDRVQLAAFGIRHLRQELDFTKDLLADSERKVASLAQLHEACSEKESSLAATIAQLESENEELHEAAAASEQALARAFSEKDAALQEAAGWKRRVADLSAQNSQLLEAQRTLAATKSERDRLRSALQSTTEEVENWKACLRDAEEKAVSSAAESDSLKRRLSESSHLSDEAAAGLRQKFAQLELAAEAHAKEIAALQHHLERARTAVKTVDARTKDTAQKLAAAEARAEGMAKERSAAQAAAEQLQQSMSAMQAEKQALSAQLHGSLSQEEHDDHIAAYERSLARILDEMEHLPWDAGDESPVRELLAELAADGSFARPETVATAVYILRKMDRTIEGSLATIAELEAKVARLKTAIRKWAEEGRRQRVDTERLEHEKRELAMLLRVEKKQADEKVGQLILALRR